MNAKPRTVVGNLADWELPSLEARMDKLVDHLAKQKIRVTLDADILGDQLHAQLWDHLRELGATAANEAIAGWLQGLADGRPELCVKFAYLEGDVEATPLTLTYSVAAEDGSRAELQRVDLEAALLDTLEVDDESPVRSHRLKTLAARLRKLAATVESELPF